MRRWFCILPVLAIVAAFAPGWWVKGHESITAAAATRLPDAMPAFFRNGGTALAHAAGDPDRWKNRDCAALRRSVEADHYLDLEDLAGGELPRTNRFDGIEMIRKLGKDPVKVGMLPYAVLENYERLACAFADHRKEPENEIIRWKCLIYGGVLAHYTTDASMPLHTTIHFDGRVNADGTKTQKGIHARLDAFPEKFKLTSEEIARGVEPKPVEDVWAHFAAFLKESATHIDAAYEFDKAGAFDTPTEASRAFVLGRCRAGAQLTAEVWWAAWVKSGKLPAHY
jgi:hypothetical protein